MKIEPRFETVELRGYTFTVHELTIEEYMPIIDAAGIDGGDMDMQNLQRLLFAAAVKVNGEPVDPVGMPAGIFMPLVQKAMELNALDGGTEGND